MREQVHEIFIDFNGETCFYNHLNKFLNKYDFNLLFKGSILEYSQDEDNVFEDAGDYDFLVETADHMAYYVELKAFRYK